MDELPIINKAWVCKLEKPKKKKKIRKFIIFRVCDILKSAIKNSVLDNIILCFPGKS